MRWDEMLSLRKSDRRVLLALLVVLVIAFAFLFFYGEPSQAVDQSAPDLLTKTDSLPTEPADSGRMPAQYYSQPETFTPERFAFDPNTADSTQLLRLGLQPWQVRNIYKYRAAGGIYRKKEDFARLYGLTVKQYRELEPYIQISADYLPAATLFADEERPQRDTVQRYPQKLTDGQTVDVNAGDTIVYRKVPGIGSYFARRIADYGRRLGGYVSIDQLDEIEGFPQDAKSYFVLEPVVLRKVKVNQQSLDELKRHPYINYYRARAIVDYRRQHGPLKSLEELRLLPDFTDETIRQLSPYIDYD